METHSRNRVFGGGDPPNKQKNDGLKKWASSTVWSTSTEGDRNNENSSKSTSTWDAKSVAGSEKSWTNTDDGWSVRGDANANKQQPPQPKQPTLAELMSAKKTGGVATATTRQATGGFGQQRQSRAREPPLNHLLGSFASNNSSRSFLARLDTVVGGGRQRSKSHGRSQSGGRSQSRGRNGSHGRSKSRGRREKYMPPKREEVDLFGESRLVQQGEIFEQVNKSLEETIIVLNSYGENLRIRKLEQFEQANFSSELMLNLQLTKFRTPTPIQKVVIPVLLGKRRCDLIAHAPTGCGKTGAFLLPIVRELQALVAKRQRTFNPDQPYALIVVPTKELAQQLYDDTRAFALRTGVSVCYTHGDMPMKQSLAELGAGCDIFISTCGRLGQFIEETYITLEELRYLVLDEADKLLKIPSFLNCIKMVKRHNTINPAHRTLMFSATYAPEISHMVMDFLRDGNFIQVMCGDGFGSAVDTVEQTFFMVERPDKQDKLIDILLKHDKTEMKQMLGGENYRKVPKTIVFVEEKRQSYKMTMALIGNSIRAVSLNADLSLKMRHEAVGKFATDECDVLVATNLGARGLNFPLVRLVINYDLPQYMNAEREYIHQIGRTGRIGNVGNAISFFDPESVNDCRNAAYYIKVLEDSHSDVPDWLRKVAAEYAQPEGAKKAEEPEAPAREQQQENEETKTESTEKGTTICSSSEEEEETTSEEEAEEAASRASTLKSKRSGDTWLTASNKNVYLGKKKIVGQGKKKQNKWAVTSSEEEEETTNEERED